METMNEDEERGQYNMTKRQCRYKLFGIALSLKEVVMVVLAIILMYTFMKTTITNTAEDNKMLKDWMSMMMSTLQDEIGLPRVGFSSLQNNIENDTDTIQ
jgi:hypothetical protein